MRVTVHLYNELRPLASHLPAGGSLEVPAGATPADVLRILGIPPNDQAALAVFCNGRPANLAAALKDGDRITAFSPMNGG